MDVSRDTSYVTQVDIHLSMLTVRETLQFAAEMRMDSNETPLNKGEYSSRFVID